jgi:hypothetical protein
MPRFLTGTVSKILDEREGVIRAVVTVDGEERQASAFTKVSGPISEGDRVVVNVTGIDLGLGTGGEDFVLWNLERDEAGELSGGHILKLRYTPWQIDTISAEAPESPHHTALQDVDSLEGMLVVACGLHSQVAAGATVARFLKRDSTIVYLMTDGAALPIAHSNLVAELRDKGVLDATVTCGHAFGGDFECVNVFSGLAVARWVCKADVVFVAMGPGVVGTGTRLGHTEMEQGQTLNAVAALGGRGIASVRISFADQRERHRVMSHHSMTALKFSPPSTLAIPALESAKFDQVMHLLRTSALDRQHRISVVDAEPTFAALDEFGVQPETMGRKVADDPDFFRAAGAAGIVAGQLVGDST